MQALKNSALSVISVCGLRMYYANLPETEKSP
jgi:hypothetical protein